MELCVVSPTTERVLMAMMLALKSLLLLDDDEFSRLLWIFLRSSSEDCILVRWEGVKSPR